MHGFQKSATLYNLDRARHHRTVVICEGVTDVWKVGPNGVAVFGKTLSEIQATLLQLSWGRDGTAVVLLDSDARLRASDYLAMLTIFGNRWCDVHLPAGHDPGSLTTSELHALIRRTAAERGLPDLDLARFPRYPRVPAA